MLTDKTTQRQGEDPHKYEERILILTPTGRDGPMVASALQGGGVYGEVCRDIGEVCAGIESGAGAVLLAAEALDSATVARLMESLGRQPAWSRCHSLC